MTAGAGADTLIANDGERDTIDCGTNPRRLARLRERDAIETSSATARTRRSASSR